MADNLSRYNALAWDKKVQEGWEWTVPNSAEAVNAARNGDFEIYLTPKKPVPRDWYGDVRGKKILGLACGGGQQCPLLAAAGGVVTVFDNSNAQLNQDRAVAERDGLEMSFVQGDMRDLSCFENESFDLIVHPVSNTYVDDPRPVWKEAFRVLRKGGAMISGMTNPLIYMFDNLKGDHKTLTYKLPYADRDDLPEDELKRLIDNGDPLEFSHTLQTQLGGQTEAGFVIAGFFEDNDPSFENAVAHYCDTYFATKSLKL